MEKIEFFKGSKKKYNLKDKIVFYTKQRKVKDFDNLYGSIKKDFPSLKVFYKHYELFSTYEDLPHIDLFEVLVILPNNIVKEFYNSFKDLGYFLKNEELINPLKEI